MRTGRQAIIEQFLADGMDHMFGNPGTVEQGFLDALRDYPQMKYVLSLQESVAVMIADGYARATKKPTLVQLHSTPGVGNAIGALYQAKRGHAPLVVIGGDAGVKYLAMDAQMAGDLVAMCEPVTKYSTMVLDPSSLLRTLRRAIKIAATPPTGPVYVCLPADVLDALNSEEVFPTCIPSTRVRPEPADIVTAADWLLHAEQPMMFIGDGVAYSGAQTEVATVAELVGAEVWGVDSGEINLDTTHPLYMGQTGHMFGFASHPITSKGDANLVVGTYMVPEVFPNLGSIYKPGAKTIHFDLNAYEIAKNHLVSLGVVSDPKLSLQELIAAIQTRQTPEQKEKATARLNAAREAKEHKLAAEIAKDEAVKEKVPMTPALFMKELAAHGPKDLVIFDEALTSSPYLTRYLPPKEVGSFFQTRGGSLGVGIPGALGVKLAKLDKPVIAFTGDGGAMYTIQALWSALRHNINAKFVVCNNASYKLLQLNIDQYWKENEIAKHDYPPCFDLSHPPLHFDQMARAFGVESLRVEKPEEIVPAIQKMFAHDGPFLIDLILENMNSPKP